MNNNKTDNYPTTVALEVLAELERAKKKHPEFPTGIVRQVAIMAEEAGEAIREANRIEDDGIGDLNALRTELIQTAAMCIRCLENLKGYEDQFRDNTELMESEVNNEK